MREILFRGKRVDNGSWVYGDFCKPCNIVWLEENKSLNDLEVFDEAVQEETIGQYTGLEDNNGNKIFEGDIVELYDKISKIHWTAIIEFGNPNNEYTWGWQLKPLKILEPTKPKKVYWNEDILCWVDMDCVGCLCEIIGNIYDNPELLEVAE